MRKLQKNITITQKVLKCGAGEGWKQWCAQRGVGAGGGGLPPRNSEVLTELSRIPSSVENTSITT
jgi:hypothetical protein